MIRPFILTAAVLVVGCGSGTKTSTGRTERETDSVIANSALPGAPAVKKAMDVSDTARSRVAAQDTASQ